MRETADGAGCKVKGVGGRGAGRREEKGGWGEGESGGGEGMPIFPVVKILLSAVVIYVVTEVVKRSDRMGALLASLPFVSIIAMVWMYHEAGAGEREAKVSDHAWYTFWYVLPTLPRFLGFPVLGRWLGFSGALGGGGGVRGGFFLVVTTNTEDFFFKKPIKKTKNHPTNFPFQTTQRQDHTKLQGGPVPTNSTRWVHQYRV